MGRASTSGPDRSSVPRHEFRCTVTPSRSKAGESGRSCPEISRARARLREERLRVLSEPVHTAGGAEEVVLAYVVEPKRGRDLHLHAANGIDCHGLRHRRSRGRSRSKRNFLGGCPPDLRNLGDDAERDFPRRLSREIEPRGASYPLQRLRTHARLSKALDDDGRAFLARDESDVRGSGGRKLSEGCLVVPPHRRDDRVAARSDTTPESLHVRAEFVRLWEGGGVSSRRHDHDPKVEEAAVRRER